MYLHKNWYHPWPQICKLYLQKKSDSPIICNHFSVNRLKGSWYEVVTGWVDAWFAVILFCCPKLNEWWVFILQKAPRTNTEPWNIVIDSLFYEQIRETEQNLLSDGKVTVKVKLNHRMLHRGSVVARGLLSNGFSDIMDTVMALAFIKESALQMRLFASLCNALGEYRIPPSEVRWHTCGRVWSWVMVKIVQSSLHILVAVSSERKITYCVLFLYAHFLCKKKKKKRRSRKRSNSLLGCSKDAILLQCQFEKYFSKAYAWQRDSWCSSHSKCIWQLKLRGCE